MKKPLRRSVLMSVFTLAFAFIFTFTFTPPAFAQSPVADGLSPSPYTSADFASKAVTLKTEHAVYAPDVPAIAMTITNNTNATIAYDQPYSIEMMQGGEWYSVPFEAERTVGGETLSYAWPSS